VADVFDTLEGLRRYWAIHGEPHPGLLADLLAVHRDRTLTDPVKRARIAAMLRTRLFGDLEDPAGDPELGDPVG